ncbi:hypothetical protein QWY90_01515 [Flavobacterium paronense]|nr:hypothetical protein [Flavobacterium paronense]MDN3675987.1 hypothetical protein [Flavobacterium paronense]
MQIERQFIYDNPICLAKSRYFHALMKFESWRKPPIPPAFMFVFTLTNGNNEEQELVLQRREGKWEIADFIRPNAAAYLSRLRQKLRQIKAMS